MTGAGTRPAGVLGLHRLLPPGPLARTLTVVTLLYSLAVGAFLAGGTVFLVHWSGLSAAQVGITFSIAAVVALACTAPVGVLADRLGTRGVWLAGTVVQAAGYACYPLIRGFGTALLLISGITLTEAVVSIARQTYSASVFEPRERARTMAYFRAASNVGMGAGALIASVALGFDRSWMFAAMGATAALMLLTVAVLVGRLPAPPSRTVVRAPKRAIRNVPYLTVSALSGVLLSHATVLSVVLPLWILSRTDAPTATVAWCFVVNTVLTVLLQVAATRGAEDLRGGIRAQRRAAAALVVMCAVFATTRFTHGDVTVVLLMAGVILLTGGELLHSAGAWTVSIELAPPAQRGEYLAAFRLGVQAQTVVGPAALTALIVSGGTIGWLGLAAAVTAAAAALKAAAVRADGAVRAPASTAEDAVAA